MASAWGSSWGSAWGNAWGVISEVIPEVFAAGSNSGRLKKDGRFRDKYGRLIVRKKPVTVSQAAQFAVERAFLASDAEKEQKEVAESEFRVFLENLKLQWRVEYVNELWEEYEKARLDDEMAAMALLLFEQ